MQPVSGPVEGEDVLCRISGICYVMCVSGNLFLCINVWKTQNIKLDESWIAASSVPRH